ncbi:hypothetical protein EDD17DRAFT_1606678 [Pisolithus thermaeus]|nr:hypothetical protein EDD17DRAFT_1606678 [Pisolithus thermaeus]
MLYFCILVYLFCLPLVPSRVPRLRFPITVMVPTFIRNSDPYQTSAPRPLDFQYPTIHLTQHPHYSGSAACGGANLACHETRAPFTALSSPTTRRRVTRTYMKTDHWG